MGDPHNGLRKMKDVARRLRTQKASFTDSAYLERMAREVEARGGHATNDTDAEGASDLSRRSNPHATMRNRPNE